MLLDMSVAYSVKDEAMLFLDEGLSAEEVIPGLVLAIRELASMTGDPEVALDEAADLMADPLDEGAGDYA